MRTKNQRLIKEIKNMAYFHAKDVPVVYGDGEEAVQKMLPLYELEYILGVTLGDLKD